MLKGKNVNLRKPDIYDAELFNKWFADLDYAKAFNSSVLNSKSQAKLSFLLEENLKTYGNTQTFIIENKKGEGLGFICLSFIRWKSKNLCLEIYLDAKQRGTGNGADALALACIYSFWHLNMHRVYMFINEFNKNALGIAFKTSKNEGILRNHIYYDGKYWNAYVLGMLKDEFEKQTDKLAELGFTYVKTKQYV